MKKGKSIELVVKLIVIILLVQVVFGIREGLTNRMSKLKKKNIGMFGRPKKKNIPTMKNIGMFGRPKVKNISLMGENKVSVQ
jgi:septation ring formation regulator EzrA